MDEENWGNEYTGSVSKTRSGKTCQFWNSQLPHKHTQPEWNHNYCRNPTNDDGGNWCYTVESGTRWEYCSQIKRMLL